MNSKTKRNLSALAASLFLLLASSSLSFAAGNFPSTDWVIRSIPEKGKSGLSYCSLNTTYTSGQKLFIARDAGGVNTVALDFQKDILEVGRQYVVFAKSGGFSKQYTAIAATKQVMIMKVGNNSELLDGFVSSRSVSFRLGADTIGFNFSESIIDALNALTDCADVVSKGGNFEGKKITKSELSKDQKLDGDGKFSPPAKDFSKQVNSADDKSSSDKKSEDKQASDDTNTKMKLPVANEAPRNQAVVEMSERIVGGKKMKKPSKKSFDQMSSNEDTTVLGNKLSGGVEVDAENQKKNDDDDSKIIVVRDEFAAKERVRIQQDTDKLKQEIAKLKDSNQKLTSTNETFKYELERQKLKSDNSKLIVDKTKQELLDQINSLKSEQGKLVMNDFQIQKENQEILLDTQKRQKDIIEEIKRLKDENERLQHSNSKEKKATQEVIDKNQVEMDHLREENKKLALQNELQNEKQKKQDLESTMEQNHIRSELLKLQSENTKLAMDYETGRADSIQQTNQIKQQNIDLAQQAQAGLEDNRNMASMSLNKHQQLAEETQKLKSENEQLKALTEKERAETEKIAQESQEKQKNIEDEIARIKQQNDEMMQKIKNVKEQTQAMQQSAASSQDKPISLLEVAKQKLNGEQQASVATPVKAEEDKLKKWLYNSGAAGSSYIEVKQDKKTSEKSYNWKDNNIVGTAKEITSGTTNINSFVEDYMKRMSNSCRGDFAKRSGTVQMVSYYEVLQAETACMGKKDTAAVVLFVVGNDKVNVITQETVPDNVEFALQNRDKILSSIE